MLKELEIGLAEEIMNNKLYLTKEEYEYCFEHLDNIVTETSHIGDYFDHGAYLNLRLYSENEDGEDLTFKSEISYINDDLAKFEDSKDSSDRWVWLMKAVERIEGMRDENGNAYRFHICMCNAYIENTDIEVFGARFKEEAVYKAALQFTKIKMK